MVLDVAPPALFEETDPVYSVAGRVTIHGEVDAARFADALRTATAEAEVLHGGPRHWGPPDTLARDAAADWLDTIVRRPFTAAAEHALGVDGPDTVWCYRFHRAFVDEFGAALFVERVAAAYNGTAGGPPDRLDGLDRIVEEEAAYRSSPAFHTDREFWRARLAGHPEIPAGRPATAAPLFRSVELTPAESDSVRAAARAANTPWTTVATAAVAVYAHRLAGAGPVPLGLPVAGRAARRVVAAASTVLPVRVPVAADATLVSAARAVAREIREVTRRQRFRWQDLHTSVTPPFGVVVHAVALPADLRFGAAPATATVVRTGPVEDLHVRICERPGDRALRLDVQADAGRHDAAPLADHVRRIRHVLVALAAAPAAPVARTAVVEAAERRRLVGDRPAVPPDRAATVPELFARRVAAHPAQIAVDDGRTALSYGELNASANRLARLLVARGAGPETLVALALPRTVDAVTAILAVLKAGAGYVPVDPAYPSDRIAAMRADARPIVTLTETDLEADAFSADDLRDDDRIAPLRPGHPAYVIYTSGSTGRPKGVLVPHANVAGLAAWAGREIGPAALSRVLAATSFSFDVSVFEILVPLLCGGSVRLVRDALALIDLPADEPVSLISTVPSVMATMTAHGLPPLRPHTVVLAGEALPASVAAATRATFPDARLANIYGPTEATVYATAWFDPGSTVDTPPPIGRPLDRAYVLDAFLQPAPAGVPGELYLGGERLARGYHNRPGLTASRFVADPFTAGARMYRTGDLARWNPDGTLDYLGRTDDQVKIRGHRIEPGDIESALSAHPAVGTAVVVAQDGHLVAYVVPVSGAAADPATLRAHVAGRLPDFMVPAHVVPLSALPVTPNGKLDRAALPAPATNGADTPGTDRERLLAQVFADVLGVPRVRVRDSFFDLGGDSIVAIQLVSRARRAGLAFDPQDVFEHKTVAALATVATDTAAAPAVPDADDGTGRLTPTPIIEWLRHRGGPVAGFHQSVLLSVPGDVDSDRLTGAVQAVIDRHDTLRMRLARTASNGRRPSRWSLHIDPRGSVAAADRIRRVDVAGLSAADFRARLEGESLAAQRRLDPDTGAMVEVVWFDAGPRVPGRLLLMANHLVIDGVSWRILVPDLIAAWRDGPDALAAVGTSYRRWAETLRDNARTPDREDETDRWLDILDGDDPALGRRPADPARDTTATARTAAFRLGSEPTELLLTQAPAKFGCGPDDVLLTGLALAVNRWRGTTTGVLLDIEGHGREHIADGLDLSRTVGWFTSVYPVRLRPPELAWDHVRSGGPGLGAAIKATKETLRAIPDRGVGFGLLRYLNPHTAPLLAAAPAPQIGFNYLGRFTVTGPAGSDVTDWAPAPENTGLGGNADPDAPLPHALEIGLVAQPGAGGAELTASVMWAGEILTEEEVKDLVALWFEALVGLARHTARPEAGGLSPSDLPAVALTQDDVDRVVAACPDVVDVLPLTGVQEGLLFHANYDRDAPDVYRVQLRLDLDGPLDAAALRRAADALLDRHPNLRAAFLHEGLSRPVQVIPRHAAAPFDIVDASEEEADRRAKDDRDRPFDLARPPLIRFTLLRLAPDRHRLVITNHHILADGWSTPLLIQQLLALCRDPGAAAEGTPYRDYVTWIAGRDRAAAAQAWDAALGEPTLLAPPTTDGGEPLSLSEPVPDALTHDLTAVARRHGVTVNTVVQAAWALTLGRFTGRADVTFGGLVAVRPPEISGIEAMIGLSINVVPVRVRLDPTEPVAGLLTRLQREQASLIPHQHLSLREIQRGRPTLFDTVFAFENYPMDADSLAEPVDGLRISGMASDDSSHYPLTVRAFPRGGRLHLTLDHRPGAVDAPTAERILATWRRALQAIVAACDGPAGSGPDGSGPVGGQVGGVPVGRLDLADADERRTVLAEWNDTARPAPGGTLPDLFRAVVAAHADAPAVVTADRTLTYRELDSASDRLARRLVGAGVQRGDVVALALPRSIDLVTAALATVKAGAAYLPVDPAWPAARTAALVVGVAAAVTTTPLDGPFPRLDPAGPADVSARLPDGHPDLLAYVMHTSGSTGTPKAVGVSHRAVAALAHDHRFTHRRILLHSPVTFDANTFELWVPLLGGGTVVVAPPGDLDLPTLADLLATHRIGALWLTAGLFRAVAVERPGLLAPVREVWTGGDVVSPDAVRRVLDACPDTVVVDGYGPTESTTFATCHPVRAGDPPGAAVPIGRPLDNTRAYVLDASLRPAPAGVPGELYLGGAGLARGYLDDPAQTAARFVADPFTPGGRLYRTGDLVRWNPDGTLHYLGRTDHQVKVRGHRVEPGEIEAALAAHPSVAGAVVVARADGPGEKRLVAYVVGHDVTPDALRGHLRGRLPEHLVPAAFVTLAELPLTRHGKVDRAALPAPEAQTTGGAPRTDRERLLAGLFADVLGFAGGRTVGVDDGFFDLGGDSISALQLVSRARVAGLALSPRQVVEQRTVAALAAVATPVDPQGEPDEPDDDGSGPVPTTPIIEWLRHRGGPVAGFSQAVLLAVPPDLGFERLVAAVQAVIDHHDALRMRVDDRWELTIGPRGSVDARALVRRVDGPATHDLVDAARRRLDPAAGTLLDVVWFDAGPDLPGRLLLTGHHLATDGVSLRILGPDLAAAWRDGPDTLTPVGASFRRWARRLAARATSPAVEAELGHWLALADGDRTPLGSRPLDPARDTAATARRLDVELDAHDTARVLTDAAAAFHCRPDEILLAGLALALGPRGAVIDVERHGRDDLGEGLDLSRTVGWFTSIHPVRVAWDGGPGPAAWNGAHDGAARLGAGVKAVKEALRATPGDGIGHGLLRYLNPKTAPRLADLPTPEIAVNYLGRFTAGETSGSHDDLWAPAPEFPGLGGGADPDTPLAHALELTAVTVGPRLQAHFAYAGGVLADDAVTTLATDWLAALRGIADAVDAGAGGHSPADFPLVALTQREIERIERDAPPFADLLPLAPLQDGLLFHAVSAEQVDGVYVVEFELDLDGPLDAGRLRAAAAGLLRRHANLGAGFLHEGLDRPVQVIPARPEIPWEEVDVDELHAEHARARFDPARPPLLRFRLARLGPDRHRLLITVHHIVLDGWSAPLLLSELLDLYAGVDLPPVTPFREHLAWVARQDRDAARDAWRRSLDGLPGPTLVAPAGAGSAPTLPEHVLAEIPAGVVAALGGRARRLGVTVNTLLQTAWAMTIAATTDRADVVFGATVSGRPPEVAGVETMVGLFINTLPVRVRLDPAEPLRSLVTRVQAEQWDLIAHQHLTLGEVQRLAGQGELFDTAMVFENFPMDLDRVLARAGDLRVSEVRGHDTPHFALALAIIPTDGRLDVRATHRADLIARSDVERALAGLRSRLERIAAADPDRPVGHTMGRID